VHTIAGDSTLMSEVCARTIAITTKSYDPASYLRLCSASAVEGLFDCISAMDGAVFRIANATDNEKRETRMSAFELVAQK
jgi:hypothetical protein